MREINQMLNAWLLARFQDSWWTPDFKRLGNKMIADCEIETTADLTAAIDDGDLERVIDSHLERMTELVRKSRGIIRLDENPD